MGTLHWVYAAGVYALLARYYGHGWPTFVAFAAAIPTYMFFSQAPFLSHDIAPGGVLLWMLFLGHEYLEQPRLARWILLVLLGAAVALMKPIYAGG